MTTRKFIKRILIKALVLTVFLSIIAFIVPSTSTIISNELAMEQMENSNEAYIAMDAFNRMKPLVGAVKSVVVVWFTFLCGCDTYNLIKTMKNNKEN